MTFINFDSIFDQLQIAPIDASKAKERGASIHDLLYLIKIPLTGFLVYLLILLPAIAAVVFNKLTPAAGATGAALAVMIFLGTGLTGLFMLAAFFVLGTAATSWKAAEKQKHGVAESNRGRRSAMQVLANGALAALFGGLAFITGYQQFMVLVAACLASATADTLSSELGVVYGRRFYNIINLKPDIRGRDGVVSIEGSLIGMAGSAFIALIYALGFGFGPSFWIIIFAGTVGNMADSVLGATAETKGFIGNDMVNFLNTVAAALAAAVFCNW